MNQEHEVLAQSYIPALDGPVSVGASFPCHRPGRCVSEASEPLFRTPSLPDGLFQLDWRQEAK
jgi:hypothetical protein